MTKILGFLAQWLGVKALKIVILVAYYAFVMAFYAFMISSITQFYNLIHDLLNYASSYSSSVDLSKFFGLLDCIGFTDALLSSLPAIISSLIFLFTRLLWVTAKSVKKDFVDTLMGGL